MQLLYLLCFLLALGGVDSYLQVSTKVISVEMQSANIFEVEVSNPPGDKTNKTLVLIARYDDLMEVVPSSLEIDFQNAINQTRKYEIKIYSFKAGRSEISIFIASDFPEVKCLQTTVLTVEIYKCGYVEKISQLLGWSYFFAWSLSFYPQIYSNYKNKSVVGLSFDFILFNLFGYIMYIVFNVGMYFIPYIKEQYTLRHPRGVNPVYTTDLYFSLHSFFATVVSIYQCIQYPSDNQKTSKFAQITILIGTVVTLIFLILAALDVTLWINVLYICSYMKLLVTLIKYMPQIYLIYKRKTTQGWSCGSVILDLIGGILSIIQLWLDGYNYGDWTTVYDNPTKFGLGYISIVVDCIFLYQHFHLYKDSK